MVTEHSSREEKNAEMDELGPRRIVNKWNSIMLSLFLSFVGPLFFKGIKARENICQFFARQSPQPFFGALAVGRRLWCLGATIRVILFKMGIIGTVPEMRYKSDL